MKAIVTFSLGPEFQRKNHHNPNDKESGTCPLEPDDTYCTDITGAHHSRVFEGEFYEDIVARAMAYSRINSAHVTRIELIEGGTVTLQGAPNETKSAV